MMYYPYTYLGGWIGMIFMILFWGLIIWGIIWLVKTYAHPVGQGAEESLKNAMHVEKFLKKNLKK